jgi:hypothetical protein
MKAATVAAMTMLVAATPPAIDGDAVADEFTSNSISLHSRMTAAGE